MKPNINIIGSINREYKLYNQKIEATPYKGQQEGKNLEYRKYFNTSKTSVDKSALDLGQYCDWIGKPPQT
ncbi:MAG: hypothetical protein ACLQO7_05245 [Candidatus Bathyarchaeia archaeon]